MRTYYRSELLGSGEVEHDIDLGKIALWMTGLSIVMALAALLALPWVVTSLPRDYFASPRRSVWGERDDPPEPALAVILGVLKNIVGAALLVLGVVLIFMPGQGLLTILVGLMLMNFPGKYQLERWLVQRPGVFKSLNWLRDRKGAPPFDPVHPD